jgi:Uma2 family endonuclease
MKSLKIPEWVRDLKSYRTWAHSEDYPQTGWISFLDGEIWIDMNLEEFFTHNQVKSSYWGTFYGLLDNHELGQFVPDRMMLANGSANLVTEPDGMFFYWTTMQSGKIRLVPEIEGYMELEGTPDMTLEVVSKTSFRKDTDILRDLYWKAGVQEYWLVNARQAEPKFDILRHGPKGYVPTPSDQGWLASAVFGKQFQLVRQTDPLGHPLFVVNVK